VTSSGGFCEHGNEPSGSIRDGQFLDELRHCYRIALWKTAVWS
jgi:hypothetical protein